MIAELVVTGIGTVGSGTAGPGTDNGTPWFDVHKELGRRGYRYLPPVAHYLLAAARKAFADSGGVDHCPAERRGAAIGTSWALRPLFDELDETIVNGHSDELSPATAPFFAVNAVAGRLSSEHELRAFSLTLTSPAIAGLEAVEAGARAMRAGRCDLLLTAATEHVPGAEQGAVAMTMETRTRAEQRGAVIHGSCHVASVFAPSELVGSRAVRQEVSGLLTRLGLGRGIRTHLFTTDSPVAADVLGEILDVATVSPASDSCLMPARLIADTLTTPAGGEPAVGVAVATASGHLALARVTPALSELYEEVTTC
jgi:3-oxoacyl-[acyl-carrier-protein] synthase II